MPPAQVQFYPNFHTAQLQKAKMSQVGAYYTCIALQWLFSTTSSYNIIIHTVGYVANTIDTNVRSHPRHCFPTNKLTGHWEKQCYYYKQEPITKMYIQLISRTCMYLKCFPCFSKWFKFFFFQFDLISTNFIFEVVWIWSMEAIFFN